MGEGVLMAAGQRGSGAAGTGGAAGGRGDRRWRADGLVDGGGAARADRARGRDPRLRLQRRGDPAAVSARSTRPSRRCRTGSASRSRPTATSPCSGCCMTSAPAPTSCPAGEMRRALAAGFEPAERSSSAGSARPRASSRQTVAAGHRPGQRGIGRGAALRSAAWPRALDRVTQVGIRVNPDVTTDTHPYISTSHGGIKFGVPRDQVRRRGAPTSAAIPTSRSPPSRCTSAASCSIRRPTREALEQAGRRWWHELRAAGRHDARVARHRRRARHPLPAGRRAGLDPGGAGRRGAGRSRRSRAADA